MRIFNYCYSVNELGIKLLVITIVTAAAVINKPY